MDYNFKADQYNNMMVLMHSQSLAFQQATLEVLLQQMGKSEAEIVEIIKEAADVSMRNVEKIFDSLSIKFGNTPAI